MGRGGRGSFDNRGGFSRGRGDRGGFDRGPVSFTLSLCIMETQ